MGDTVVSLLYGLLAIVAAGGILALCSSVKAICLKILKGENKKMIDKEPLKLLGGNKKYIFCTVALQIMGMLANI